MTDNEIVKAIEKCASIGESCEDCPFYEYTDCDKRLKECFHDMLNRQKAEIERLQGEIGSLNKKYPCTVDVGNNCLVYARSLDDYDKFIGDVSAEGIKEFWNRMRTEIDDSRYKVITDTHYARGCNDVIDYCIIKGDNLVKEMVGD